MSATAKVGAFMLVALVILGVFIIKIEEIPVGMEGSRQRYQATFPSVAGLDEKSPVRVAGVRVGIVESIALKGDQALVTLALDPGVQLHEGSSAQVTSLGMLGDKYVELDPGPLGNPALPPGTVIPGTSPVPFDKVLSTAGDVGGDLKAITASLRKSLGGPEGEKRIDEILENIRQLSESTRLLVADNRRNVDATIANLRDFSETLKTELPRLSQKLIDLADRVDSVVAQNQGNVADSIANIKDLSARLRVSADNINEITGRIAHGEGSIGKLVNDETTVDNLNSTLKSVESGMQSLKDTIGRAQRWKLDVDLRAEALPGLPKGKRSRSAFGIDLQTTDHRFWRLELVDSPWGRMKDVTETRTYLYPDGTSETYVEKTERTSDAATFNAQVGYIYGDYTLRAGLFESTGGLGIDRTFLDHKLKLTLDAYDFSRDTKPPHIRIEGRYYLTRNIFTYAGWDDPVWSKHSSALIGGGVTWGDEDLKYLLGTAASFGKP